MALRLDEVLTGAGLDHSALHGDGGVIVSSMTHDSRDVHSGSLFCCVRGDRFDGHEFAAGAVAAGASALLVEHLVPCDVPQIVVPDTRLAMGPMASSVYGHPSRSLTMVGVTGTNGKTTTSSLVAAVLERAGVPTGVIGTLTGSHTTPEAPSLQARLAEFRDAGSRAVSMEVSSHALALHRVGGIRFDVGVFTNLGHDHLDLHGSIERYFAAKAMLFETDRCAAAVINTDDVHGRLLSDTVEVPVHAFGWADAGDVQVGASRHSYTWDGVRIEVGVGAAFNVMNSLAAATTCRVLGVDRDTIAEGLRSAPPVPGRFEPIAVGQDFDVIVDYAHTPDGLAAVLASARSVSQSGRVVVVFGCGGDRDRAKRPEMGRIATEGADLVVITSDNPRSEDPLSIIDDILSGVTDRRDVVVEADRRLAIGRAIASASNGDVVVIAGKGHEVTQTIGGDVLPFDDRLVARDVLGAMR